MPRILPRSRCDGRTGSPGGPRPPARTSPRPPRRRPNSRTRTAARTAGGRRRRPRSPSRGGARPRARALRPGAVVGGAPHRPGRRRAPPPRAPAASAHGARPPGSARRAAPGARRARRSRRRPRAPHRPRRHRRRARPRPRPGGRRTLTSKPRASAATRTSRPRASDPAPTTTRSKLVGRLNAAETTMTPTSSSSVIAVDTWNPRSRARSTNSRLATIGHMRRRTVIARPRGGRSRTGSVGRC